MGIRAHIARRRAVAAAVTLATALAAAGAGAASTAATAAARGSHPAGGIVHTVSPAAQTATQRFWTAARMTAATPQPVPRALAAATPAAPPDVIPEPTWFKGVPTVGTLFFTTGTQAHFCSASVVNSFTLDLVLTAAHCVYGSAPATNIEFVPQYHHGHRPYGSWPVQSITVAAGWQQSHDPNLDFAFLAVSPPSGTNRPVQLVTGGLWLGVNQGYSHPIEVIGYNNTGNAPIECATSSFKFETDQMKFYCRDYQDGTSGGPWIVNYNPGNGTGVVIGVIGGFDTGGNHDWASYSAYFGLPTLQLYLQAQHQQTQPRQR